VSAGWGRFQGEGTGPDWLAPEEDEGAKAPGWGADSGGGSPGGAASGWAAGSGSAAETPTGWSATTAAPADGDTRAGWSAWAQPAASAPASAAGRGAAAPAPLDDEPPAWLDEPDEEPDVPHRSFAKPERKPKAPGARTSTFGNSGFGSSGFGEGGRGGSRTSGGKSGSAGKPSKSAAAKPAWQSRRKDRDPAADGAEPAPKKPQSREKLEQRAKNILLYHLARQMQTRSQLADRLRKKEIPDDIAAAVLDRFEELHLLDDASYAETFVRSRHNERGLAKRALGYELRKRGVDDDTAQEALATLDEDQEAETARRLVEGRLRSTRNLDQQVRVRRLVAMLARKGYSSSVAMRAVKEALAEEGERLEAGLDPAISDALDDAGLD
jgi:regulatory protein